MMPRGAWTDASIAKRQRAARKAARTRKANRAARAKMLAGEPLMTRAEIDALRGTQIDRVMSDISITEILARLRETPAVPRETSGD